MNHYTVDILTPAAIVAKDLPAESLLVPTSRGQVNILKDHTHLVTNLSTGILSVFGGEADVDKFYSITTGTCKILDNKIIVMASVAEEVKDIDKERAVLALNNATEKLKAETLSDEEIEKFRRKVARAKIRIQLFDEYGK